MKFCIPNFFKSEQLLQTFKTNRIFIGVWEPLSSIGRSCQKNKRILILMTPHLLSCFMTISLIFCLENVIENIIKWISNTHYTYMLVMVLAFRLFKLIGFLKFYWNESLGKKITSDYSESVEIGETSTCYFFNDYLLLN